MTQTPRKNRLSRVVFLLAMLAVSISLGEIVLQLVSSDGYYVWPPGLRHTLHPVPETLPGIEGDSRFYINDDGLRGDRFSGNQTYRILAIGSSTTECLFLDEEEAWPYLLQKMLNASAAPGQWIWVGNAGRGGRNTTNHLVQMERLIEQYPKIDAVLLLIGANDFLQRLARDRDLPPFSGLEKLMPQQYEALMNRSFSAWPGSDSRYPFFMRTRIWRRLRYIKNQYLPPFKDLAQDDEGRIYEKWRMYRRRASSIRTSLPDLSTALEAYAGNVHSLISDAKSKGVRIILMTQPYLWRSNLPDSLQRLLWFGGVGRYQEEIGHEYYSIEALASGMKMYNERLLSICRTTGVECIDLESQLPKYTSVFYDDAHFNESGSRRVATIISEYLSQNMARSY